MENHQKINCEYYKRDCKRENRCCKEDSIGYCIVEDGLECKYNKEVDDIED